MATGQGIPDMKDLMADTDTPHPPAGGAIDGFNSFRNFDTGPTIAKKQKLSIQKRVPISDDGPRLFVNSRLHFTQ